MDVQGDQYSLVSSGITPDPYVLVKVRLLGCPIVFELLLHQNLHSLFPSDRFVAGECTGETGQATGEESFIVISTLCVCCASPAACCW